ncbi:hypothetical protein SCIP_0999 [Scardovia inopinata JCM 12537]|nr:hypothetical protein SCIP_0999 [Scardovia inopinata JCM 12537]
MGVFSSALVLFLLLLSLHEVLRQMLTQTFSHNFGHCCKEELFMRKTIVQTGGHKKKLLNKVSE